MASDNVLAGILGALEGANRAIQPWYKSKLDIAEHAANTKNDFELYKQKLPLQTAANVGQHQMTSDIDFNREKSLIPLKEQSQINVAAQTPFTVLSPEGIPIGKGKGKSVLTSRPPIDPNKKPLSTEAKKISGNLQDGIKSLDIALGIQEKRPDINKKTGLHMPFVKNLPARLASIGDPDAQRYIREVKNASDVLARYRTGAAINNQELETYENLLNDPFVEPDVARENLQKVMDFFVSVNADLQSGKRIFKDPDEIKQDSSLYDGLDFTPEE